MIDRSSSFYFNLEIWNFISVQLSFTVKNCGVSQQDINRNTRFSWHSKVRAHNIKDLEKFHLHFLLYFHTSYTIRKFLDNAINECLIHGNEFFNTIVFQNGMNFRSFNTLFFNTKSFHSFSDFSLCFFYYWAVLRRLKK